ncbi:MAG: glycosyl hydrolase-related protein [Hyphomicrobiales bacterium]
MARTVYVVPHCHWDREWYQPHELFRWRLVQMIDELLDYMEQHPEFRCFTLDGQTVVIEDYLELRPENEHRLRAMIEAGRIVIGPWWVQPDELLPTGESHIRSFQRGIRQAQALGGCLQVGHCADQFGHIAQMPQLMAQLGLTSACLWRGVPDSVPGWSFHWQAPDGTTLPVLYLRHSYSSGWRLPMEPEDLIERTRRQERARRGDEPLLLMNGTDHSRMEKHVPEALVRAAGQGYDYQLVTLAEYERAQLAAGIDPYVHPGELRSPDNSNVLVGVLSARMNIKQRDFEVASWLERYAEPLELLSWQHGSPDALPALKHAWRLALENTPHDSICGCSVDQTHREMLPRYDRAEQLARQVARESMQHLVRRLEAPAGGALAVFRPVPHARAVLEVDVPGTWEATALRLPDGREVACSLEDRGPGEVLYHNPDTSPHGAGRHLDFLREDRYDNHYIEDMRWGLGDDRVLRLETTVGDDLNAVDWAAIRQEVREIAANNLADRAELTVVRSGRKHLTAVLPPTDTIGVQLLTPATGERGAAGDAPAWADARRTAIGNGFYEIRLRKRGLEIRDLRTGISINDALCFVSEGDRGDEYNADILDDPVFATLQPAGVECDGVAATLAFEAELRAPAGLAPDREARTGMATTRITGTLTLHSGLPWLRARVEVDNQHRDHRLRALVALPFEVTHAITENTFHVAERPLEPQPYNGIGAEQPPTTFPQKTFAAFEAGSFGLAVFNRGLPEGEVVRLPDGRQAYGLTLLRCVGWLSRDDLRSRRGGAGPTIATPEAQMPGRHTFEFALTTYTGGWREAGIQPLAHSFAHPPLAYATNEHPGSLGADAPLARITSPQVVPSALHRSAADGAPIIRVYNASPEPTLAEIEVPAGSRGAGLTDLLERHQQEPDYTPAGWRFPLRPWQIQSVRFGRRGAP